jgi:phosphoribosylamine--glycine ligase
MRFLGIGEYCDLGDMYRRLEAEGHDVRVYVESPAAHDVFGGMLSFTPDWRAELQWVREAGEDGIVLFESAMKGELQDQLRRECYQVIGGSGFGDRLESDRQFGQDVLRSLGLCTARTERFTDFGDAIDFVRASRARCVFKNNGGDTLRTRNYVGELEDGTDMIALLSLYRSQWRQPGKPDFVLMEHVEGVEVGVGAYFNGRSFLKPACLDWEHKRLFPGELGELTGEMGTIVTYRGAECLFDATLARMADPLRESGYCGYINLNLIANEQGLWPLEFTSRFGYPGYAICEALHIEPWDALFRKMVRGDSLEFATAAGFAAGVVLTVPPFPYSHGYAELSKGAPISFRASMSSADYDRVHLAEVALQGGQLVTSGTTGYVGVSTGAGDSVEQARDRAYALARKVVVPNLRYRVDIGERLARHDLPRLEALGYLAQPEATRARFTPLQAPARGRSAHGSAGSSAPRWQAASARPRR